MLFRSAHWLEVMKDDKKATFIAASLATRAIDYLYGLQPKDDPAPGADTTNGDVGPARPAADDGLDTSHADPGKGPR